MEITKVKQKFYKENPNVLANFVYNQKLGKYICYVFDYSNSTNKNGLINEETRQQINQFKGTSDNPFNLVLEYFSLHGIEDKNLEKISDCYYECVMSGKQFNNTNEVCDAINAFVANEIVTQNTSNSSLISAYVVEDSGEISNGRIFYMDVSFITAKTGEKACKIENTFTEEDYRNNGIHAYGIKFLEAVLAKRHIYTLVGESMECDAYTGNSLNEHYKKLGFSVFTDKNGTSHIIKDVDAENSMQLEAESELIK